VIGGKRVFINDIAIIPASDQLAPVDQDCHAQRPVSRPIFGQPTFCRGVLAILLLMAALRSDEYWLQGEHPRIARCQLTGVTTLWE
jgi:hypothetical protein